MSLVTALISLRNTPGLRRISKELLAVYCLEVPQWVRIGKDFTVMHRGFGTVIHPSTVIGGHVTIYQGVTVGVAEPWSHEAKGVVIEDGAMLCAGATVLC